MSNDSNILQQIEPNSDCQTNDGKPLLTSEESSHVFGLTWNHASTHLLLAEAPPLQIQTELLLKELSSASSPLLTTVLAT